MNGKRLLCEVIPLVMAVSVVLAGKWINSFAGPYDIGVRRAESGMHGLSVDGKAFFTQFRRGRPQHIWGFVNQTEIITDESKADVDIALWANNQWKHNAFILKFDQACTNGIKYARDLFELLFGADSIACPFLPRYRIIKNQSFRLDFPTFKVFPYGRYLMTINLTAHHRLLGVLKIEGDVIPRL